MSGDERSPKRQRRSYSPASPPEPATKAAEHFVQQPQTPPPSVHMSPSWQSQPLPPQQEMPGTAGPSHATSPILPPPGATRLPGLHMSFDQGDAGAGMPLQTPAVEASVTVRDGKHARDSDEDVEERDAKRIKVEERPAEDVEHRTTDHERQEAQDTVSPLPETSGLYLLSTEPIAPMRPHFSQNMLGLYGLTDLQASVARKDEYGNKINKLRKSYEGKVKALGLEGKPKARVNEDGPVLQGLVDSGWDVPIPEGGTLWEARERALPIHHYQANETIFARLEGAMAMRPGRLPREENDKWVDRVGLEDSLTSLTTPAPAAAKSAAAALNPALARTAPAHGMRASAPSSPRSMIGRPDRLGKRRRYDESSYTGYQESYDDDGYSTGGMDDTGRRRSGSKKQKRPEFGPSVSSPPMKSASVVGS